MKRIRSNFYLILFAGALLMAFVQANNLNFKKRPELHKPDAVPLKGGPQAPAVIGSTQATMTQSLFDELNKLVPLVGEFIVNNLTIPDKSGTFHIAVLGEYEYSITDMKFHSFTVQKSSTQILGSVGGIKEDIIGATVTLSADYFWKHTDGLIHYSDHGTVDILVTLQTLELTVQVSEANMRPTVNCGPVTFVLGQLQFTFHGKVAWIYQDLESLFNGIIVSEINERIPAQIQSAINTKGEEALAKLRVDAPFGDVIIDLGLVAPPFFASNNSFFSFGLQGEWTARYKQIPTPPYKPVQLPMYGNSDMIQVFMGDYFVNTAAWTYFYIGKLDWTANPNDLPAQYDKYFNTSFYYYTIPELYYYYPNKNISINAFFTAPPVATFNSTGFSVKAQTAVNVSVILSNTKDNLTTVPAFSLAGSVNFPLKIAILNKNATENDIVAHLGNLQCNLTVVSSQIGNLEFSLLSYVINEVCSLMPDIVNPLLDLAGFPIPHWNGFSLVDPTIFYGANYLGIGSSVTYNKP